jgi:hypothetical protein
MLGALDCHPILRVMAQVGSVLGDRGRDRVSTGQSGADYWYGSLHSGFDLRRSVVRLIIGQGATARRSCVCDGSSIGGGCGCPDEGRAGGPESCWVAAAVFSRVEPWLQAGKYVARVASNQPKRNGWAIASGPGTGAPKRTQ